MAAQDIAQITGGENLAASIEAPELERIAESDLSARASTSGTHGRNIRATRVVGSLDHAVLPMPPVRSVSATGLITEC
jgi:hypothetical protein